MSSKKGGRYFIIGVSLCLVAAILFVWVHFIGVPYLRIAHMLPRSKDEDGMTFFQRLGPGWNLGNALDAHMEGYQSDDPWDYERLWHNTPASEGLFTTVYDAGFRTVRIPITWYPHMDDGHNVDPAWMERVQEVVDSALECGLYVIINAHHDAWYVPSPDNIDYAEERLAALWSQVATHFIEYDERLLFEGMNEPRLIGSEVEWQQGTEEARGCVNRLNGTFLNAIRSSGGKNAQRFLLVTTYAASVHPDACTDFMPPQDKRVGISLHLYHPFAFTHQPEEISSWSQDEPQQIQEITGIFDAIHTSFLSRGVPVVITEFGAVDKGDDASRLEWAQHLTKSAAEKQISCIWWDNGTGDKGTALHTFALLDRGTLRWYHPAIAKVITDAYYEEEVPAG